MQVLILLALILALPIHATSVADGLVLIKNGKAKEGYSQLEEHFNQEMRAQEKGELAYLLSYAPPGMTSAPGAYYARYALKYAVSLSLAQKTQLKIYIADSFMGFGEFKKAKDLYEEILKEDPSKADYVNYQLGYYYLNTKEVVKAYSEWIKLVNSKSPLGESSLKSLGRYWEKMNFPGDIKHLSAQQSFKDGFAVSVDEREKELTLEDLNRFVRHGSSSEMIGMLVTKNLLFMKDDCGFVNWYRPEYKLDNSIVFPLVKRCTDKVVSEKALLITEAQASSVAEKLFLLGQYQRVGKDHAGCKLADKELKESRYEFLIGVFTFCPEKSESMYNAIRMVLQAKNKEHYETLKTSRVIRASFALAVSEQQKVMNLITEEAFVQELLQNEAAFLTFIKVHQLSDDSLIRFVLFNDRKSEKIQLVRNHFSTKYGKDLVEYLSSGKSYDHDLCSIQGQTMKRIALESKITNRTLKPQDLTCADNLLSVDHGLKLLGYEEIIKDSTELKIKDGVSFEEEFFRSSTQKFLPSLDKLKQISASWSGDVAVLLRVQNHQIKAASTSKELIGQMKALQKLKNQINGQTWTSQVVSGKTVTSFNDLLSKTSEKNNSLITKLDLKKQFDTYFAEMRFP